MITFILYFAIGLVPLLIWKSMFEVDHDETVLQVIIGVMWVFWPICVVVVCIGLLGKIPGMLINFYEKWQELQSEKWKKLEKDEEDFLREKE